MEQNHQNIKVCDNFITIKPIQINNNKKDVGKIVFDRLLICDNCHITLIYKLRQK